MDRWKRIVVIACLSPVVSLGQNPLSEFSRSIRSLTERVSPAVVQILVRGYAPLDESEGQPVNVLTRQRSTGSGVIVDEDGYIVTNAHVVRGAVSVRVLLGAGSSKPAAPVEAKIVGLDRETDLALLKVTRTGLPTLQFGDSDSLRQGDVVLAIGSPLGLQNSVSMGVVSAPTRQISEDNPMVYVQTDASINPGNSGGALVNVDGLLVGINSFILTQSGGSEGIGFAVPSNIARNVYEQLKKKGHVHRGEIGAFVQTVTPVLAAALSLTRQSGVILADMEPDGPAEQAGLQPGDILLSLDGHALEEARQFEMGLYRRQKGDKVSIKVLRDNRELAVTAAVIEKESDDDPLADLVTPDKNLVSRLGILCIEIDKRVAAMIPDLRKPYGLIIAAKSPEGQGRYIDLQPGDVIHAINNVPAGSLVQFRKTVAELKAGSAVALQIERDGRFQYIAFEIE